MRVTRLLLGFGLLVSASGASWPLAAADMPAYMDLIAAGEPPAPSETARRDVLALNMAMFGLYDEFGPNFQKEPSQPASGDPGVVQQRRRSAHSVQAGRRPG